MHKGEVRQELRTTQPEQPTEDFLQAAAQSVAEEIGLPIEKLRSYFRTTYDEVSSPQLQQPIAEHRLAILWYGDQPVATALETRTELNMVLTQTTYFGTTYHEAR